MENFADLPISSPDQDSFAVDAFARSLARSIVTMDAPDGVVLAINGTWGSGKTSIVNLVEHHLNEDGTSDQIEILRFNPWWFSGEEALTVAFFREISGLFDQSLGEKGKSLFTKIGARVLKGASTLAPVADAVGGGGLATASKGSLDWLAEFLSDDETVDNLHAKVVQQLKEQSTRFLVIIDDIDRLDPDEALAIFRLVKSVGQLPNVIYLLSFDRILADSTVGAKFPSEGPRYLDKIIQVSFDIPKIDDEQLVEFTLERVTETINGVEESDLVEFLNLFHEVVSPKITTPRDATKFINSLSVTYPAVAEEVDDGDYLAIEALRIFEPDLYKRIRENGAMLTSSPELAARRGLQNAQEAWENALIGNHSDVAWAKRVFRRLFPICDAVWANTYHSHSANIWQQRRRVCTPNHFATYFRFSLSKNAVSAKVIEQFIGGTKDADWIAGNLKSLATPPRSGQSEVARLLDALTVHGPQISFEQGELLLSGLFSVADDVDLASDEAKGMSLGNNKLRIHWLLRAILFDRTSLEKRSAILTRAFEKAQLGWMADFFRSAWKDWHPDEGNTPEIEEKCLLTLSDTMKLRKRLLSRFRDAAKSHELLEKRHLPYLLYNWRDIAPSNSEEVKDWTSTLLKNDETTLILSSSFISHSWSHGIGLRDLGDLVSSRSTQSTLPHAVDLIDLDKLRTRLFTISRESSSKDQRETASKTLESWSSAEKGEEN